MVLTAYVTLALAIVFHGHASTTTCVAQPPNEAQHRQHLYQQSEHDHPFDLELLSRHLSASLTNSNNPSDNKDLEWYGLRPIKVMGRVLGGLDSVLVQQAFRGKKIMLVGDSTLMYVTVRG